jgi:nucleotide-binding universal stress UspA family protein
VERVRARPLETATADDEEENFMAKRILVPLDLTDRSEAILPLVADLAKGASATVRLLHVAATPDAVHSAEGRVISYVDQEMARIEAEVMDGLAGLSLRLGDVAVERAVRFGRPVDEILQDAEEFGADLLVFTAGYHRDLGHLLLGSTSAQLCRRTTLPVVVLRPALDAGA